MEHFYKSILILCVFFMLSPSSIGATPSPTNIFILGGQSNMAGRGGDYNNTPNVFLWDGYIPPESQPNPSILKFNINNQWEEGLEPLHKNIDLNKTNGISPGMAFANQLLAAAPESGVIGLVPCAIGGTHIANWTKSTNPQQTRYAGLVDRIKASQNAGGQVRALFWLQGESDASVESEANAYEGRLKQFFTDLRNDLKPIDLPIIMVKIASIDRYVPHTDHLEVVRAAQEAVSREWPDVKIIDAMEFAKPDGTGFNKDRVHFNTNTEVAIGKKLADTYLSNYSPNV